VDSTQPAQTARPLFDNDQGDNDQGDPIVSIAAGCYANDDPDFLLASTDLKFSGTANQVDNLEIHFSLDGSCSAPLGAGFFFTLVAPVTNAKAAQRACRSLDQLSPFVLNAVGYSGFPADAWACAFNGSPDAAVKWTTAEGNRRTADATQALFAPPLSDRLRARLAVGIGTACNFDLPLPDLTGKIALISRGVCAFTEKFANAQAAEAVGVIVYNDRPLGDFLGELIFMAGPPGTEIPGVFISLEDGTALEANPPRRVTLSPRRAGGQNNHRDRG
jgi:hypothetical protein